jgi:hypothetical protein
MSKTLSDRMAKAEPVVGKNVYITDTRTPGFQLVITASGGKYWAYQYRWLNKTKRITIGSIHDLLCNEARTKAEDYKRALKVDKRDPGVAIYNPKEAITLTNILKAYVESRTDSDSQNNIDGMFRPFYQHFHGIPVQDFTAATLKNYLEAPLQKETWVG